MAYIDNWFHFYDTTESFEVHRKQGLINPDSICFLGETGQVYTQKRFFGICRERYEKLEQLVLTHDAQIKNILGIEGPSVGDGVVNNIADLVNFLDGFTDEDNLKDFLDAMKGALESQIREVNKVLSEKIAALEAEIHEDSETLHNTINAINSQVDTIGIRLDNHDTVISVLNTSLSSHIRDYNTLKTNYENFKSYAGTKFDAIDSSISSINTSITTLQQEFTNLDAKFDNVENEVAHVGELLEEAKQLVRDLETRFGETLAAFEQFKRDINDKFDDFQGLVGAPYGIAPLDGDAKVPSAYLPSYVDDVLEYATKGAFPVTGESGKIYVALDDNLTYRWSGSTYIEISKSLGLGETATTAYAGNKGKKNADDIAAHKADTNNPHNVTKTQLGLDKVSNTSDEDKPVSTAQATAIKVVQDALDILDTSLSTHVSDKTNPHQVTKAQVGLGKVDNTADSEKPVSAATQAALNTKVDKIVGKGLSTNDFTNEYKTKIDEGLSYIRRTSEQLETYVPEKEGDIVYVTDTNEYKYWNGTEWREYGVTSDSINEMLLTKANLSDLNDIVEAERVMDEDTYPNVGVNLATREQIKKELFVDLWNKACGEYGTYNSTTGFFELNGLTDITYDEALKIYILSMGKCSAASHGQIAGAFSGSPVIFQTRTVLPIYSCSGNQYLDLQGLLHSNGTIQVIRFTSDVYLFGNTALAYFAYHAGNLKHVYGVMNITDLSASDSTFNGCNKLETIYLGAVNRNQDLGSCKMLSLASLTYLVQHRRGTNEITIIVHPDVYAKLTDTTNTEWNQVLTDATAKNITFVTV